MVSQVDFSWEQFCGKKDFIAIQTSLSCFAWCVYLVCDCKCYCSVHTEESGPGMRSHMWPFWGQHPDVTPVLHPPLVGAQCSFACWLSATCTHYIRDLQRKGRKKFASAARALRLTGPCERWCSPTLELFSVSGSCSCKNGVQKGCPHVWGSAESSSEHFPSDGFRHVYHRNWRLDSRLLTPCPFPKQVRFDALPDFVGLGWLGRVPLGNYFGCSNRTWVTVVQHQMLVVLPWPVLVFWFRQGFVYLYTRHFPVRPAGCGPEDLLRYVRQAEPTPGSCHFWGNFSIPLPPSSEGLWSFNPSCQSICTADSYIVCAFVLGVYYEWNLVF